MKERYQWIDLLKGFAIFLVVFGHNIMLVQTNSAIFITKYIYSFHMPLFFMISGLLFNKYGTFREYIVRKAKNLLIPYFSFASILYLFWFIIGRKIGGGAKTTISPFQGFMGIFYGQTKYMPWGGPLWFLLCLFIVSCLFYIISKYSQKIIIILLFLSSLIGFLMSTYLRVRLPWMIDTAFTGLTIYGISYLLKCVVFNTNQNKNLIFFDNNMMLIGLFLIGLGLCIVNSRVELAANVYGNYILFYLSVVSSCLFYILLFKKIFKYTKAYYFKKYFIYFGRNSLIVLGFHARAATFLSAIYIFILKVDYMTISIPYKILYSLIQLTLLIPVIYVLNKYLFVLLGKSHGEYNNVKSLN